LDAVKILEEQIEYLHQQIKSEIDTEVQIQLRRQLLEAIQLHRQLTKPEQPYYKTWTYLSNDSTAGKPL
jgi:hypothetical protein